MRKRLIVFVEEGNYPMSRVERVMMVADIKKIVVSRGLGFNFKWEKD